MQTLSRPIDSISFYEREKNEDGSYVRNKCGRDFLYYALHYYFPERFNSETNNPYKIDQVKLFGQPVPAWLAWSQLQFARAGQFLASQGLQLTINDRVVDSYLSFVRASLLTSVSFENALSQIKRSIDADEVCALDLPVGGGPFVYLDHVMFVYGYDENALYVFDTHVEPKVDYEKVGEKPFYFKLPISVIKSKWTFTGRVWRVVLK